MSMPMTGPSASSTAPLQPSSISHHFTNIDDSDELPYQYLSLLAQANSRFAQLNSNTLDRTINFDVHSIVHLTKECREMLDNCQSLLLAVNNSESAKQSLQLSSLSMISDIQHNSSIDESLTNNHTDAINDSYANSIGGSEWSLDDPLNTATGHTEIIGHSALIETPQKAPQLDSALLLTPPTLTSTQARTNIASSKDRHIDSGDIPATPSLEMLGLSEATRAMIALKRERESMSSIDSFDSIQSNDPRLPSTLLVKRTNKIINNGCYTRSDSDGSSRLSTACSEFESPKMPTFSSLLARTPHYSHGRQSAVSMRTIDENRNPNNVANVTGNGSAEVDSPLKPLSLSYDNTFTHENIVDTTQCELAALAVVATHNVSDSRPVAEIAPLTEPEYQLLPQWLKTSRLPVINEAIAALNSIIDHEGCIDVSEWKPTKLARQALTLALTQSKRMVARGGNVYSVTVTSSRV